MPPSTITKYRDNPEEGPRIVPPAPRKSYNPVWKRRLASWSRWLHIYLSMVSFAILFFFAVTGLTLNHQDWFARQQKTRQWKGALDTKWLRSSEPGGVDKLAIVEQLRYVGKVSSAVSDFRVDDGQCSVSFKGPGYTAEVMIDRATGAYDVTETRMGLAAVLNDLHKGRDSGRPWAWMIDVSAVFMTLVSASGIVLVLFLQKRRYSGLLAMSAGAVLCTVIYLLWTP